MKTLAKLLNLILVLFLTSTGLIAQGVVNIPTLEISLLGNNTEGTIEKLEVSKGSPVIIKFTGLNPLRYNYALNHEFVNLFSEGSTSFVETFNEQSNGEKDKKSKDPINELENKIKILENTKSLKNEEIKSLAPSQKKLSLEFVDSLETELKTLQDALEALEALETKRKNENISFFTNFFKEYPIEIAQLRIVLNTEEDSEIVNARNGYRLILENSNSLLNQMNQVLAAAKGQDDFKLDSLKVKVNDLHTLNNKNWSNFKELISSFPYPDDVKVQDSKKSILSNFEKIEKNFTLVNSLQDFVQTPPIDYHGGNFDYIKISLETVPVDKTKPINRIQNYEYNVWIKGGLKIDFSAGLFISSLRDKTYESLKVANSGNSNSQNYKIIEKNQGKYEFGIGSTVNFTCRSSAYVNVGGAVGGYITTDQKFRFLAGPTLVLGKMERLIFSAGMVIGEITTLSNRVNLNDAIDLGADGTVPTVQKFDLGHYFSFTYNLSKAKSDK